jgi:hypothetical protein
MIKPDIFCYLAANCASLPAIELHLAFCMMPPQLQNPSSQATPEDLIVYGGLFGSEVLDPCCLSALKQL